MADNDPWASATERYVRSRLQIGALRMPRYFFDSRDGETFMTDDIGVEFSSVEEARDQAAVCLAEMAKFVLPGSTRRELTIEVRDGAPVLMTSLVFEAVRLK